MRSADIVRSAGAPPLSLRSLQDRPAPRRGSRRIRIHPDLSAHSRPRPSGPRLRRWRRIAVDRQSTKVLGNGRIENLHDSFVVDSHRFERSHSVARQSFLPKPDRLPGRISHREPRGGRRLRRLAMAKRAVRGRRARVRPAPAICRTAARCDAQSNESGTSRC
jgi:hypothetical protein